MPVDFAGETKNLDTALRFFFKVHIATDGSLIFGGKTKAPIPERARCVSQFLVNKTVRNAWFGSCFSSRSMSARELPSSDPAHRPAGNAKPHMRDQRRTSAMKAVSACQDSPSRRTLARTKALLLAALRLWELKHRTRD
jgi:hypothetical protein